MSRRILSKNTQQLEHSSAVKQNIKSIDTQISKLVLPKRVIPSKPLPSEIKSSSTGKIHAREDATIAKPKKTTKSNMNFKKNKQHNNKIASIEHSKNIGDNSLKYATNTMHRKIKETNVSSDAKDKMNQKQLMQFYRNDNFHLSSDSVHVSNRNNKKTQTLDPIKEVPELHSDPDLIRFHSRSESEESDQGRLKEVEEFRQKNFFECHSDKSKLFKDTTTPRHICTYSFYLNERLFPVPLKTDYKNTIRCNECNLPIDDKSDSIDGTIQAKVAFDDKDTKDVMLLLPAKDSLIIKEKRKEKKEESDTEVVYFGVVRLDNLGHSKFCDNAPSDSFALRYEKGYRALADNVDNRYAQVKENDIIII